MDKLQFLVLIISMTVSDINDSPRLYSDNLSCLDQVVLRVSSSSTLRNSIRHVAIIIIIIIIDRQFLTRRNTSKALQGRASTIRLTTVTLSRQQ